MADPDQIPCAVLVGEIVIAWGSIERIVANGITLASILSGSCEQIPELEFKKRLAQWRVLLSRTPGIDISVIERLQGQISNDRNIRDHFVHGAPGVATSPQGDEHHVVTCTMLHVNEGTKRRAAQQFWRTLSRAMKLHSNRQLIDNHISQGGHNVHYTKTEIVQAIVRAREIARDLHEINGVLASRK